MNRSKANSRVHRELVHKPLPETRRRMKSVRQAHTNIEREVRSVLFRLGLRFRVNRIVVPGSRRRADVVFAKSRLAIFIDGCFWHSCPQHKTMPKTNTRWWRAKLAANVKRDRDSDRELRKYGWKVIRVWEHQCTDTVARRVLKALADRKRHSNPNSNAPRARQAHRAKPAPR
jgi:DNA mismatch endonuclease, patch repair protein